MENKQAEGKKWHIYSEVEIGKQSKINETNTGSLRNQ